MTHVAAALLLLTCPQDDGGVKNRIETMKVDLNFADETFENVVDYLRERTGLNLVVDPEVPKDAKVSLKIRDVRLRSALKILCEQLELGIAIEDGVLRVMPRDKLKQNVVTRVYDPRGLFVKINNFPGPRLELLPGNGAGAPLVGAVIFEDPTTECLTPDFAEELIREVTGEKAWDNPDAALAFLPNGLLMVTQTKAVHADIERLLSMMRELK